MKKLILATVYCVVFATTIFAAGGGKFGTAITHGGKAKITLQVVDDEQSPVEDAMVEAGFYYPAGEHGVITSQTDTNGLCSLEGMCQMDMWYRVTKDGYYRNDGKYIFGMVDPPVINNHWQPWNPTNTVVLKPIKNPIPMYVKQVEKEFPVENNLVGFDLEKGDWISPYGGGIRSDFLISFSRKIRTKDDYEAELKISFSNEKDGIYEVVTDEPDSSQLWLSHEAPEAGYATNWVSRHGKKSKRERFGNVAPLDTVNYFYRVRTVLDENGKIKEACYGKIHRAIAAAGTLRDNPRIIFQYYFNPTPNDRNVEFDPDKNLFGERDRFAP